MGLAQGKCGSASGTGASLTVTVGFDAGVAIPGFTTIPAGHTAALAVEAPGAVYAVTVTDSHGVTNKWTVNSTGGGSTSGCRSGLVTSPLGAPLASGDTIAITWSGTPPTAASANLIDLSGVASAAGVAVVDPHGTETGHGSVATQDVVLPNPLTVAGCIALSVFASSSATGSNSITTADATSGGTWTDLAYPTQPAHLDIAVQVVPGKTAAEAAWSNSAGAGQNTDVLIVAFQPVSTLTVGGTPAEVTVGDHVAFVPDIEGGTGPFTAALAPGSGPLPPGLTLVPGGGGTVTPGQFGCTYHVPSLGSIPQATKIFEGTPAGQPPMVERLVTFRKAFFGPSDGSGSIGPFPQTFGADTQGAFDLGMKCYLVYKPAYNKTTAFVNAGAYDPTQGTGSNGDSHGGTQADWRALKASLIALKALGLDCEVVLWHEIEHQGLAGFQYWSMLAYYSSAVIAALGAGHIHHVSSAAYNGKLLSLFPGKPNFTSTCFIDGKVWTDCYTHTWLGGYRFDGNDLPGGTAVRNSLIELAQRNGKQFGGVMEMGAGQGLLKDHSGHVIQVPGDTPRYVDYLTLCAAAYPGSSYAWYADPTGPGAGTNDVMPGYASGLNGGFDARPNLRNLCDTILGAGGGGDTPEIEGIATADGTWPVTLKVTDSLSATATGLVTFVIDPAVPPPPPPPPPPVPVPVPTPDRPPTPKPWQFLITMPQPDGTILTPLSQAATRTFTVRAGPTTAHEAAFDISGDDGAAGFITEMECDLQVQLGGQVLLTGRLGAIGDTFSSGDTPTSPGTYRLTPAAVDYKEILRRRSLAQPGGPNFQGVDVADIAWQLIQATQGSPGGNLGIARGAGRNGTGITRFINTIRQNMVGGIIDQLAQMDPGEFDWDVTPYGPADLRLDVWPGTQRGDDKGVELMLGGPLVDSIARTTDPSTYANSVFVTGQSNSAQTSVAADSDGGTIANIDHWGSPSGGVLAVDDTTSFTPSGALIVHDSAAANAIVDYTGRSGPTFVGCTVRGSPAGTVTKGNYVYQLALDPVQLDAFDIATRPEGRWDQVIGSQAYTQDAVNAAAAWYLKDGEVLTPSYVIVLKPGAWGGPDHIWIGDTVRVIIQRGRLNVNDKLPVMQMDFDIDSKNVETVTLTLGRIPYQFERDIPNIYRRIRYLETH